MPQFQRKQIAFLHKGMNWNTPVEKMQEGQVAWAKNIRVLEQGTVSAASGNTLLWQIGSPDGGDPGSYVNYVHSISRMNILNEAVDSNSNAVFDPAFRRTYVVGGDENIYAFQDADSAQNPTLNPLITPKGQWHVFSGNPLSIVDAQPTGAAVPWKYIGDSEQMVKVGYYPGDKPGQMARCINMGLDPPVNQVQVGVFTPGNLLGDYSWSFAYRRLPTGARSNPSAATRADVTTPSYSFSTGSYVAFYLPQTPPDPQTGLPDTHVVVDVYRYGGNIFRWALVGSGPGGSTFTDNIPDENLLAAPSPPQATDASTGLTRFNLFRPFVTQDIQRSGQAVMAPAWNNARVLTWANGDFMNPQWLAGSSIFLAQPGGAEVACTIYQVSGNLDGTGSVELQDDFTGTPPPVPDGLVNWRTPGGTLMAGQPLPHLWGPYGIGQSGSYIFACGDPNAKGTLYWTNGNDPDSTDIVNNIQVTSPSERLMTGCVYGGQPYCWSTERQFQIYPSAFVFGQFTTQEVAGAKGCWLEWSLTVQSNGISDQSVSWRGKDGIYDWSVNGGLQRLTDPLYGFFPHNNQPGIAPESILSTIIGPNSPFPENVGNLDDTRPRFHRLCWFQGLLYYDFVALTNADQTTTFSTLVWDSVNTGGGGWISLDQPFSDTTRPVARGIEIGANLARINDGTFDGQEDVDTEKQYPMHQGPPYPPIWGPAGRGGSVKVSWGNRVYEYYGLHRGFETRFITRPEDLGDSRAPKLWGDFWLDCTPLNSFDVYPLVNFSNIALGLITVPANPAQIGVRTQFTLDFVEFKDSGGKGLLTPTLGLDIHWVPLDGQFSGTLNQWSPSFTPKPEQIEFRATDREDQGNLQAKYLMGCNIEADTRNFLDATTGQPIAVPNQPVQTIPLNVIIDGVTVATLQLNHDGQLEKPYAWEPVAGYEFQVQFKLDPGASEKFWQLYNVLWIFEVWPDSIARKFPFQNLGTAGAKYIRGIVMPMETGGNPGVVGVWGDDEQTNLTWTKTTLDLKKMGEVLDLPGPFVAHNIQFYTLTDCRIWPTEAKVDFDPWPESSTEASAFTDLGYVGAKWMQGMVVPMETGGKPVSFTVRSDCGQYKTLGPVATQQDCKMQFAFSFSPCNEVPSDPFIGHEFQVAPQGDARIWYDEIKWIWEPEPELVATWCTQPTDHDLGGWHSLRDCFIAYRGGNGTPVLSITTEYGTESYPLDPVTTDQYTRCYRVLKPQKAKWRQYRVEGCGLFRLYIKDCAVRVKEWGSTGPYVNMQPFGDLSRTNGGARI